MRGFERDSRRHSLDSAGQSRKGGTDALHNKAIQQGLTGGVAVWAFQTFYASNWHPVTWLSHALDWQLYGSAPGGQHLTSLLLHGANAALLFLVLFQMSGERWRSALVAAVFAWHPLHVESVAWVAERKDVLSALFFLLTLRAYAHYARSERLIPVEAAPRGKSRADTAGDSRRQSAGKRQGGKAARAAAQASRSQAGPRGARVASTP